jgi:benzoyl-CoA reductase/2-hydroxyglutaryl-CoA dehydratase subunit BcrC/BadD/HgdB
MDLYQRANLALTNLSRERRAGRIPSIYFQLICNSFFYDSAENWTRSVNDIIPVFAGAKQSELQAKVFLTGSPVFFPNLKIHKSLEEAGLYTVTDDLCSSGRLLPGSIPYEDNNETAILKALAQRYHQGCLCPSFEDNDRRINSILAPVNRKLFSGVIYHVLKGCHPFDLESLTLENRLKAENLKYLRLETDFTPEDSQNIMTRLEAFKSSFL